MMIEDAGRFGLAQIHQFRGRVGRGDYQSFCFLFSNSMGQKAIHRLKSLEAVSDGFELAEIDLETRGPGDVFGKLQSGQLELKMASFSDRMTIESASRVASEIIDLDSSLETFPKLKEKLAECEGSRHFE
jgi:ATP-dependent DNA helicase RecG